MVSLNSAWTDPTCSGVGVDVGYSQLRGEIKNLTKGNKNDFTIGEYVWHAFDLGPATPPAHIVAHPTQRLTGWMLRSTQTSSLMSSPSLPPMTVTCTGMT